MAGVAWKLMAFMFLINISAGLFNYLAVTAGYPMILSDESNMSQFNALEGKVSGATVEGQENFGEKFLDFITFGLYDLVKNFLKNTIFGFPTLLYNTGIVTDGAILAFVNVVLSFIYVIGTISLITRTDIAGA